MTTRINAIWVGRFQPPTIAHYVTMECILEKWKHLHIGIVSHTPRPAILDDAWFEYLETPSANTLTKEKNPFTSEEVCAMWHGAIECSPYAKRVVLIPMPRIAYQSNFNLLYPEDLIDFVDVAPHGTDSEFDQLRRMTFEKLLDRQIHYVSPRFKLHNTQIRNEIQLKKYAWSDVLPAGCYAVFTKIGGPERIVAPSSITG